MASFLNRQPEDPSFPNFTPKLCNLLDACMYARMMDVNSKTKGADVCMYVCISTYVCMYVCRVYIYAVCM